MESLSLRLIREKRRVRRGLVQFFDALALYLLAGFDLAFAWNEALLSLDDALPETVKAALRPGEEGLTRQLQKLAAEAPLPEARLWFSVLGELYIGGAAMGEAVRAASDTLRADHARALDEHCRKLPLTGSLVLLFFFLPATLALIFIPLLSEISAAFTP